MTISLPPWTIDLARGMHSQLNDQPHGNGLPYFRRLVTVVACLSGALSAPAAQPNVLFIAVDDLRTELGCYGAAIALGETAAPLSVHTETYIAPLLVGSSAGPLRRIRIDVAPADTPVSVTAFQVQSGGTLPTADIQQLRIYYTGGQADLRAWETPDCFADATRFAEGPPGRQLVLRGHQELPPGIHYFWIAAQLNESADVDQVVSADCEKVVFSAGRTVTPRSRGSARPQRLGIAVRRSGEDGVHTYRIPGLARTNEGTLVAVYDIRRRSGSDLPSDIDIGMSRSTDGGHNWEPMQVIMDMGDQPQWRFDGIGDPSVLVDRQTNTIWVAAVWSHGPRGWSGSQPGMAPAETGQLMLVRSDDDGLTWSAPINITTQVKRPEWSFLLQGPGKGITMRDGTLVFPAQYQDTPANQRLPRSTIIYSRDRGESWQIGTGAFDDTTEAQVVEVEPGVLMLNCRYNRQPRRVVMTTRDMGQTWTEHSTSQQALVEPGACMASFIDVDREVGPHAGSWLLFSNPNSTQGRHHMTIKVSADRGLTWPEQHQLLLDEGSGAGYSCLAMIDEETVGILYEGSQAHLVFQRVKLRDIVPQGDRNGASREQPNTDALPGVFRPPVISRSRSFFKIHSQRNVDCSAVAEILSLANLFPRNTVGAEGR